MELPTVGVNPPLPIRPPLLSTVTYQSTDSHRYDLSCWLIRPPLLSTVTYQFTDNHRYHFIIVGVTPPLRLPTVTDKATVTLISGRERESAGVWWQSVKIRGGVALSVKIRGGGTCSSSARSPARHSADRLPPTADPRPVQPAWTGDVPSPGRKICPDSELISPLIVTVTIYPAS